jgi:hypothetical protein
MLNAEPATLNSDLLREQPFKEADLQTPGTLKLSHADRKS